MKLFALVTLALAHTALAAPSNALQARGSREDPALPHVMDAHWYWRRIHCAQDLTWDPDLAQQAFESVNACTQKVQHVR
jgi:hypothetical protein